MGKKTERVNLYNKGRRTWPLIDGGKNVELRPNRFIEVDKVLADRMIKNYPTDFMLGNKPEAKQDPKIKALKKQVEELTAKVAELEKDKLELIAINEEMEKNIEELTAKEGE